MLYKLYKILKSGSNGLTGLFEGFKKGPKGIIKSLFLILFALYVFGVMIGMYSVYMLGTYKYLAANGNQHYMPFVSMVVAIAVIFFFGFTSVASSYYTGTGEEFLMSLPLTPGQFFGAKFAVSFVSDAIMGIGMFAISSCVYGYYEKLLTNPLFYLGFLISAIAFSVTSVFIIYLLFILVLYFIPALRKKKILTIIATIFLIVFVFVYAFLNSSVSISFSNPQFVNEKVGSAIGKLYEFGSKTPVFVYIAGALNGKIIPILILAAISALILFVFVPLFGNLYIKSLNGFADTKSKKISTEKAEEVISKDVRSLSVFKSLFLRDYRNVVREPAFFSNGPLFVYLFPVIFIVSFSVGFIASGGGVEKIFADLKEAVANLTPEACESISYYAILAGAAYTVFSGTFANLATTSFSREGKSLNDLKAMPVKFDMIIKVKFWHAALYIAIADVITILILLILYKIFAFPISAGDFLVICIMMTAFSAAISALLIFIDMFIDTANPKLNWETPMAASKQNFNVLWSMLLSMLTVALVIILVIFALPRKIISIVILTAIYVIISAPVGAGYFRYAEKRLKDM